MNHSPKMMWMCVAVVLVAVVVTVALDTPAVLAFAVPCLLMMAAMVWSMSGRSPGGGNAH